MKKIIEFLKSKKIQAVLYVALGVLLGWIIFDGNDSPAQHEEHNHGTMEANQVWTCSMHPQIRMDEPGLCPLCAMDLIPLQSNGGSMDIPDGSIQMSETATALANIQTSVVTRKDPVKDILLYGVITPDETKLQSQTAHVSGRIERLYVNFTGESVKSGQPLATIYSPELFTAQQELIEALKLQKPQPSLVEAIREKLRLWKLTDSQIAEIERSGKPSATVDIISNTSGIVMSKRVSEGDYIQQGGVLFDIANLSRVWAMFEAYETDLAFLSVGDKVKFTLQAIPGRVFDGSVSFINPILDPTTRTAKVRVEVQNSGLEIKPQMYATANVKAKLKQYSNQIVIPQSAVLWTGKRSIVYVLLSGYDTPVYQLREIELGPSLGNSYVVVLDGLHDGEEIVSNGAFSIDASAQLEGKKSMMNDAPARAVTGHEGHAMGNSEGSGHSGHSGHAGHSGHSNHNGHQNSDKNAVMEHSMMRVEGNCGMCKSNIEKAAKSVAGVSSATWNRADKVLHLNFDASKTSVKDISKAIAKVGYDTEFDTADDKIYDALPGCCKYREGEE